MRPNRINAIVQVMIKKMYRKAGKVVIDWKRNGDMRGSLDDTRREEGSKMKHNSQVCRHYCVHSLVKVNRCLLAVVRSAEALGNGAKNVSEHKLLHRSPPGMHAG